MKAALNEWFPLTDLKPWARNPRRNDGRPVSEVAASIRRFGFVAPVVVWTSQQRVVAGHTRLKALRAILAETPDFVPQGAPGPGMVPVRWHEFASEEQADAYALADNRLGELAEWDDAGLTDLLRELSEADALEGVGWNAKEIEDLLGTTAPPPEPEPPDIDAIEGTYAVLVTCESEAQQREVLERLDEEGLKCRAWNL